MLCVLIESFFVHLILLKNKLLTKEQLMKKLLIILAVSGMVFMSSGQAQAVYVVDTGTPVGPRQWSLYNETTLIGAYQSLAGQFALSEMYTLNSLEGYLRTNVGVVAGPIDAVLYGDAAGNINTSDELFRQSFLIPAQIGGVTDIWTGVFGIDQDLGAGTYWLAFEVQDGSVGSSMLEGAPSPLSKYAFSNSATFGYEEFALGFGARIDADANNQDSHAVPEPVSMALFGIGLAGVAVRRKFGV